MKKKIPFAHTVCPYCGYTMHGYPDKCERCKKEMTKPDWLVKKGS